MGRAGNINESKKFSLKDIEDAVYDLFTRGEITLPQYLGHGLYRLENGFIVGENTFKEIQEGVIEKLSHNE